MSAATAAQPMYQLVTDADDQIIMAKLAYGAYGQTSGFKNAQGSPMPNWDQLGDTIQAAWVAAADAVYNYLMGPPSTDELTRPMD